MPRKKKDELPEDIEERLTDLLSDMPCDFTDNSAPPDEEDEAFDKTWEN